MTVTAEDLRIPVRLPETQPARALARAGWALVDLACILRNVTPPLVLLAIGLFAFVLSDQGQDVVRTLYVDANWIHILLFYAFLALWSVQSWWTARCMLNYSAISYVDHARSLRLQAWVPRILGASVFVITGAAFLLSYLTGRNGSWLAATLVGVNIVFSAVFIYVFYLRRRRRDNLTPMSVTANYYGISAMELLRMHWRFDILGIFAFFVLLWIFVCFNVSVARFMGPPAVFVSAFALWSSFFNIFSYIGRRWHIPVYGVLIGGALLYSGWNNNHAVRLVPQEEAVVFADDSARKLDAYYSEWARVHAHRPDQPLILVAAEGGGIRAGYWTASLLAALEERARARDGRADLRLHHRIFALSGVSGGSIGVATYAALLYESQKSDSAGSYAYLKHSREFLGEDFLSPVTAMLLFPDLIQRLLPVRLALFDRSRALEESWEKSFADRAGSDAFARPMSAMWRLPDGGLDARLPALFLNATHVESGRRVVLSPVQFGRAPRDRTNETDSDAYCSDRTRFNEAIDALCEFAYRKQIDRMRLSTAAGLSARFPIVTPGGRFYRDPDHLIPYFADVPAAETNLWGHVVDGGYFENSGAATALDVGRALKDPEAARAAGRSAPRSIVVLVIRNSLGSRGEAERVVQNGKRWLYELGQPIDALTNTRSARTPYSVDQLRREFPDAVFEVDLRLDLNQAPLGWILSGQARSAIDKRVNRLVGCVTPRTPADKEDARIMAGFLKATGFDLPCPPVASPAAARASGRR